VVPSGVARANDLFIFLYLQKKIVFIGIARNILWFTNYNSNVTNGGHTS